MKKCNVLICKGLDMHAHLPKTENQRTMIREQSNDERKTIILR